MYVALTRGKDEVHLTVPRMLGAKRLEPSVFISEMGLGDPAASDTPTDAPPASMAELATALRARRQRALAARIDAADAPEHLASLLLSQWAATGKVAGALPLRDRLIPEPFGSGKPLRFSFSRLSTYEACPRRFLYESVLGLESDEESASGAFGSAVHAALSTLNAGWRRSGEPPDDAAIDAVIAETWPESGFDFKAQREQLRMRARAMLRRYYAWERGQPLSRRPIEIESPIQAAYGAHTFTGRVDLMLEREDGEIEIVDFKTGSQSRIDKPAESMQLYLYDHAWRERVADRAPRVSFYALKHAEDKGFRAGERWDDAKQNRGHQHNESSAAAIREKIDGLLAGILADDFTPTPGEACGFCPCRWLCPEGSAV
jgi:RecB family exonuclease